MLRKIYKAASQHHMALCRQSLFCSQVGGINKKQKQKPFNSVVISAPLFFKYLANLGERQDQNAG